MVTPHDNIDPVPGPRVYIEPVLGELIEMQLDTVEGIMYAVVEEYAYADRWMVCYSTCPTGWRFRWLFRAAPSSEVVEPLIPGNDDVVDVYHIIGSDEEIVAVVEEADYCRTIRFLHLFDDECPLRLMLRFDLPRFDRSEESDEE